MGRLVRYGILAFFIGIIIVEKNSDIAIVFILLVILVLLSITYHKKIPYAVLGIIVSMLLIGMGRSWLAEPVIDERHVNFYNGVSRVEIEGVIADEPDKRLDHTKLTVRAVAIIIRSSPFTGYTSQSVDGKILVNTDNFPEFQYSDRVVIIGKLEQPPNFEKFSYEDYLSQFGIYSVMYRPKLRLLERRRGLNIITMLFSFKKHLEYRMNRLLPEPTASFAAGLLLGSRKGMPESLLDAFQTTGLTHIVAVSGYNVTLVIGCIAALFHFTPRKIQIIIGITIIAAFVVLTGASASVVRAGFMGILLLVGLFFGRRTHVLHILLIAAFFMVLWNPQTLLFDKGFQLSYAATLGLIFLTPVFDTWFAKIPMATIRSIISATLAAQVATLPLILNSFGRWSLIAPLSNLFVIPLIPFAMLFSSLAVAADFLWHPFGLFIGWWAWMCLKIIIYITEWFAKIPFAAVPIEGFAWWMVIAAYALLWLCLRFRSANFVNKNP